MSNDIVGRPIWTCSISILYAAGQSTVTASLSLLATCLNIMPQINASAIILLLNHTKIATCCNLGKSVNVGYQYVTMVDATAPTK